MKLSVLLLVNFMKTRNRQPIFPQRFAARQDLLTEALSRAAGRRVRLQCPERGARRKVTAMAVKNAEEALARHLANASSQKRLLGELAGTWLPHPPERIEIYDNSHIQGKHAVGGMVVAGPEGFKKPPIGFNIKDEGKFATQTGDDFAMMRQVMHRRFSRALKEDPDRISGNWPDLLLIDGGLGQLSSVHDV